MRKTLMVGTAAGLLGGGLVVVALAQPSGGPSIPPATPPKPAEVQQLQNAIDQAGARAQQHDLLEPLVGEWNVEVRVYLDPPRPGHAGADPLTSRGTMKNLWVLGRRFVRSESEVGGRAEVRADAMAMFGYDTRTRLFTMDRYDTLGTYAWHATGQYDAGTRSITFDGTTLVNGHDTPFRFVLNLADPDDILLQRLAAVDGKWVVATELQSTRNKLSIDTIPPHVAPR